MATCSKKKIAEDKLKQFISNTLRKQNLRTSAKYAVELSEKDQEITTLKADIIKKLERLDGKLLHKKRDIINLIKE